MQEPLSALAAEYQSGSPILLEKIKVCSVMQWKMRLYFRFIIILCYNLFLCLHFIFLFQMLSEHYTGIRRTRGDGNCFFRSFMFSYLVHLPPLRPMRSLLRLNMSPRDCEGFLCFETIKSTCFCTGKCFSSEANKMMTLLHRSIYWKHKTRLKFAVLNQILRNARRPSKILDMLILPLKITLT